jgi:hypothetical protein
MPRTLFVLPLAVAVSLLALLMPGKAIARPPEGVSGKMVFDEFADRLRKFRKEKEPERRIRWLEKLAVTRDPRVAIALHKVANDAAETESPQIEALFSLSRHFIYGSRFVQNGEVHTGLWRHENEADLRHRAKQLP